MNHRAILLVLAICFLITAAVDASDDGCCCSTGTGATSDRSSCGSDADVACECNLPVWTVAADALWLQRSNGSGAILGRTFNVASGDAVDTLSSADANFAMQAGTRFKLIYQNDACTAWEAVYFGMQDWAGGRTIVPDLFVAGTLADSPWTQTDKLVGGFDQSLGFRLSSRLNNVELNRRRELAANDCASIQWLAGVRYVQWDESLTLLGVNALPVAVEDIEVRCYNQMVGPQIGGELRRSWERLELRVEGKAGLLGNVFQQRRSNLNSSGVQAGGFPAINPIDDANRGTGVAGVIDCSFLATYQVTPHFSARGGYQLLYLCGLAEAVPQLGGFENSGNVFLHGPSAGLELSW